MSWLGTTVLGLQHDLYYLIYFTFALGYLGWSATKSHIAWRAVLRRNIWWSLGLGALVAFAVARQIMGGDGTPHPQGGFYGFELVWRGVVYGAVDAMILFVFPAVVAYLVLRGNRKGLGRKAAFAGLVLLFSLVVSTSYHLGYSTYRGSEAVQTADRNRDGGRAGDAHRQPGWRNRRPRHCPQHRGRAPVLRR